MTFISILFGMFISVVCIILGLLIYWAALPYFEQRLLVYLLKRKVRRDKQIAESEISMELHKQSLFEGE